MGIISATPGSTQGCGPGGNRRPRLPRRLRKRAPAGVLRARGGGGKRKRPGRARGASTPTGSALPSPMLAARSQALATQAARNPPDWYCHRRQETPVSIPTGSAWLPCSVIRPCSTTTMRSRWARSVCQGWLSPRRCRYRAVAALAKARTTAPHCSQSTSLHNSGEVLPDGRNEHGGGIPADHGRWSRCRRACSSRRRCSSGCRHHSAVISATAIRAEDSSTIAFFVA